MATVELDPIDVVAPPEKVPLPRPRPPDAPKEAPAPATAPPASRGKFKPEEVAEITINGMTYYDWKSITVHRGKGEQYAYFKFSSTEGMPLAKDWALMRIRPGDYGVVKLAGQLAIEAIVTSRQVAYTATAHGIEITGTTPNIGASTTAAVSKTGEFKDMTFTQFANELLSKLSPPVKFIPIGPISDKVTPIRRLQPGEKVWQALEREARRLGIVLGTDKHGNVTGGESDTVAGDDALVEGKNILEARETLSIQAGNGVDLSVGQDSGGTNNKNKWGAAIAHGPFGKVSNNFMSMLGSKGFAAPRLNLMEFPGDAGDAKSRSGFESRQRSDEMANVQVVVHGWLKPSGGLWEPIGKVRVKSPMLILDEELHIKSVTFTQDAKSGTRTTLVLERHISTDKPSVAPTSPPPPPAATSPPPPPATTPPAAKPPVTPAPPT